mmetsp:Transcript_23595/g.42556  ORF Transcript_23595/g.42556 Transcript_23595/m.42556 type:complete len:203 (+) Transcript_23595:68-676(+)
MVQLRATGALPPPNTGTWNFACCPATCPNGGMPAAPPGGTSKVSVLMDGVLVSTPTQRTRYAGGRREGAEGFKRPPPPIPLGWRTCPLRRSCALLWAFSGVQPARPPVGSALARAMSAYSSLANSPALLKRMYTSVPRTSTACVRCFGPLERTSWVFKSADKPMYNPFPVSSSSRYPCQGHLMHCRPPMVCRRPSRSGMPWW